MKTLLAVLLLAAPAAAEDAFVRCDRGASLASLSDDGRRSLAANGHFLDESRRVVPGSNYFIHYLYFTVPAAPAETLAVYAQAEKHKDVFRDAVAKSSVAADGTVSRRLYFEERVPIAVVPNPRFWLTETAARHGADGWRLDYSLHSVFGNSSRPSWIDSFVAAVPHPGGSLAILCKYVVPSDKRFPGMANDIVRSRLLKVPQALRDWVAAEALDPARLAALRAAFEARVSP